MTVSSGEVPRIAATSARVLPVSGFRASLRKPTSRMLSGEPAPRYMFSHASDSSFISRAMRRRAAGSASRSSDASKPPSWTQGGIDALSPVAPAG